MIKKFIATKIENLRAERAQVAELMQSYPVNTFGAEKLRLVDAMLVVKITFLEAFL